MQRKWEIGKKKFYVKYSTYCLSIFKEKYYNIGKLYDTVLMEIGVTCFLFV